MGAPGVPVNVGFAKGAFALNNVVRSLVVVYALKSTAATAVVTNSVVAI